MTLGVSFDTFGMMVRFWLAMLDDTSGRTQILHTRTFQMKRSLGENVTSILKFEFNLLCICFDSDR